MPVLAWMYADWVFREKLVMLNGLNLKFGMWHLAWALYSLPRPPSEDQKACFSIQRTKIQCPTPAVSILCHICARLWLCYVVW